MSYRGEAGESVGFQTRGRGSDSLRSCRGAFSKRVRRDYKRWLGRHDRWLRTGEGRHGLLLATGDVILTEDLRAYALFVDEGATLRTNGFRIEVEGLVLVAGVIACAPSSASHVLWDYPELVDGRS